MTDETNPDSLASPISDLSSNHPIDAIIQLKNILLQQLKNITNKIYEENTENNIYNIADLIQTLCIKDKDAIVGSILLVPPVPYSIKHMIDTASITAIILHAIEINPQAKRSIIAAALTMNIAMMNLQDSVQEKLGSLMREEQQIILNHPKAGRIQLEQAKITDSVWLEAVANHHENLNATGYPSRLEANKIDLGAKILAVADSYCSRVCPRGDRGNRSPTEVLRELYQERGKTLDELAVDHLIKQIGLFPPGTSVELNSGEDAIIIRQSNNLYRPIARRILKGKPESSNIEVDMKSVKMHPAFHINFDFDPRSLW